MKARVISTLGAVALVLCIADRWVHTRSVSTYLASSAVASVIASDPVSAASPPTGASRAGTPPNAALRLRTRALPRDPSTSLRGEVDAIVQSVDVVAGSIVVRDQQGRQRVFVFDSALRREGTALKVGERVHLQFDRGVHLALRVTASTSAPGTDASASSIDATVVGVDRQARTAWVRGPQGRVFEIDVDRVDVLAAIDVDSAVRIELGRPVAVTIRVL